MFDSSLKIMRNKKKTPKPIKSEKRLEKKKKKKKTTHNFIFLEKILQQVTKISTDCSK